MTPSVVTRVRNRLGVGAGPLVMTRRSKVSEIWSGRPAYDQIVACTLEQLNRLVDL